MQKPNLELPKKLNKRCIEDLSKRLIKGLNAEPDKGSRQDSD